MISDYRMMLLQLVDFACIALALFVCGELMLLPELFVYEDYTGASLFTVFFYLFFLYVLDAYRVGLEDFRDTIGRVMVACLLGIICSATASYTFDHWRFDRSMLVALFGMSSALCLVWRALYYWQAGRLLQPLRVLLIGVDRAGKVRQLLAEGLQRAEIIGYVGEGNIDPDAGPCLGPPFNALEVAKAHKVSILVLLPDAPVDDDIIHELLLAKLGGVMVVDIRSFYEHVVHRLPLSQINEEWLLSGDGFSLTTGGSLRRLKRALDVIIALAMLAITAPLMLLTALCIRLESPGAVIYAQQRVGLHKKNFTVYKFRSMRHDAEKHGAVWAAKNDSRVTRIGRIIRTLRIDELPQLWNVLVGDMSFIGPRPERPEFVERLEAAIPYYALRHSVKPGLTGWAQVCYPYGANEEDARYKLEYDLYYIKNMSLLIDIKILLKTLGVVLFPKGAR